MKYPISFYILKLVYSYFGLTTLIYLSSVIILKVHDIEFDNDIVTYISGWFSLLILKINYVNNLKDFMANFNNRFEKMNFYLNILVESKPRNNEYNYTRKEISNAIHDYLNLCSEEYYFYRGGQIPTDVWSSWLKGIRFYYLGSDEIRKYFDDEFQKNGDQYYGFNKCIIECCK